MSSFKKINLPLNVPVLKPLDILKLFNELNLNLDAILNRGIRFEDNVDARTVEFTSSGTPDDENTVAHALGKIPTGFLVFSIDKACSVYKGATAWTSSNIYLKVNVASVAVKILVF